MILNFNKLFLLQLFCFSSIFAQIQTGEITYKAVFPIDKEIQKIDKFKQTLESINEGLQLVSMKLFFNKNESLFTIDDYNGLDKQKWELARKVTVANYPVYANSNEKIMMFNTINGINEYFKDYEFLVEDKFNEWVLLDEKKQIDKYTCYKAIYKKLRKTSGGEVTAIITAWYCPEIPVSFGPNGYGGLPGLILELNENNRIIYHVSNIKLNTSRREIKKPSRGKRIYIEQYKEIFNERIDKAVFSKE